MVDNCANPKCAKPLHYLREGRIVVFDVAGPETGADGKRSRRMEHYWLCGACAESLVLERTNDGIRLTPRLGSRMRQTATYVTDALAS
jgi:hypothetical protein